MNDRQRPPSPVSLQELLQLKKAERPTPEFWASFDTELRRKQLSAIVNNRPWWRTWTGLSTKIAWVCVPAGTAAVVALTVSMVKSSRSVSPGSAQLAVAAQSPVRTQLEENKKNAGDVGAFSSFADGGAVPAKEGSLPSSESEISVAETSGQKSTATPAVAVVASASAEKISTDGFSGIAERFEQLRTSETAQPASGSLSLTNVSRLADAAVGSVAATLKPFTGDDPLSHLTSPREARRVRLLAQISDSSNSPGENARVARSRERITNHLSEQALYDTISRLGLNGEGVSIKF